MGIQLVAVDQALHRDIVGVESGQSAVVVNDGIDGINYPGRRIDGVKEGHAALFKRHRDRATANPQRPYPSHCGGDILRGKGFIDKIQPQLLIQIVVKTGTEVAWPAGQRHAELSFAINHEQCPVRGPAGTVPLRRTRSRDDAP